jgi:hypothetical protein
MEECVGGKPPDLSGSSCRRQFFKVIEINEVIDMRTQSHYIFSIAPSHKNDRAFWEMLLDTAGYRQCKHYVTDAVGPADDQLKIIGKLFDKKVV